MGFGDPIELEYSDPWVDDKNVSMCQQCRDPFTAVNRKHHCRRCGAVVCQKCSPHKVDLVGFAEPERFCRPCYAGAVVWWSCNDHVTTCAGSNRLRSFCHRYCRNDEVS